MTELDMWRSVDLLLKRYGEEAVLIANRRADALLDQGDLEGSSEWIRVATAITDLERKAPNANERVH